jgi:hypothetical protein
VKTSNLAIYGPSLSDTILIAFPTETKENQNCAERSVKILLNRFNVKEVSQNLACRTDKRI